MKSTLSKAAVCASFCLAACFAVMGCGTSLTASSAVDESRAEQTSPTSDLSTSAQPDDVQPDDAQAGSGDAKTQGIDYLALVNKNHPLPAGWEAPLKPCT